MRMVRWDPWGELAALQRDVGELFQRTAPSSAAGQTSGSVPPIDAYRTEQALVVRVELPGLTPDDVEVSVDEGMLSVSGERRLDADVPEDAWLRRERPLGAFQRSFSLPEGTDAQKIEASFDAGILELRIPHPPERRPHRVQIGSSEDEHARGQTVDVEDRQSADASA